jgi:tetratricopeptide (TPR) repeat protein
MAFGFGFNKQKALSSAEKFVQQGKLQNAISEYEKVLKADSKDLTVLNTVGDLYARLGQGDRAVECFKTVGDAYAAQGFTVKAIAMYKKLTKLKSSLETVLRLAELYTQQGLFNDARAQYLHVAEEFLRSGELEQAVRIFQKTLEMDPENIPMRTRLAEVYVRLGKQGEAWDIFAATAESLRARGALGASEEILQRMLTLDPANSHALLLRGRLKFDSGDVKAAIENLEKVADLDNHADGLQILMQSYLTTGRLQEAGTIAVKLASVHNDIDGVARYGDALLAGERFEEVLRLYQQYSDRLLAANSSKVLGTVHTIIGHVRENTGLLEILLELLLKSGEQTHITEVYELLAHAYVQSGDLNKAREYYLKLTQLEPQNQIHARNYQQVVAKLGGGTDTKFITAEEGAVLVEDLEATAPFIEQRYPDDTALMVRAAITDAELFLSYNLPVKALEPLVAALPSAPRDLRMNQRLAALHTRAGRFAEAAECCRTLESIYHDAGYPDEATRYGELAHRYEERSGVVPGDAPLVVTPPSATIETSENAITAAAGAAAEQHSASPAEPAVGTAAAAPTSAPAKKRLFWHAPSAPAPAVTPAAPALATSEPAAAEPAPVAEFEVQTAEARAETEIDISDEWEGEFSDDSAAVTPAQVQEAAAVSAGATPAELVASAAVSESEGSGQQPAASDPVSPKMAMEDTPWVRDLDAGASHPAKSAESRSKKKKAEPVSVPEKSEDWNPEAVTETISEIRVYLAHSMLDQARASFAKLEKMGPGIYTLSTIQDEIEAASAKTAARQESTATTRTVSMPLETPAHPGTKVAQAGSGNKTFGAFVSDLESSLDNDLVLPPPAPGISAPQHGSGMVEAAHTASKPQAGGLSEFVSDLEDSLADTFHPQTAWKENAPASASQSAAVAAAAPASSPVSSPAPAFASGASGAGAATAPAFEGRAIPRPAAAAASSAVADIAAGIDVAGMFGDLKSELEEDVAAGDEDPETHYNLGVAFREMGLLDEAISEFQKVCTAVERGHSFSQLMQTYTWLAQCFLDKQVPEAAIRWYQSALKLPNLDAETSLALHYELGSSYQAAANNSAALTHFMEVYGSNIDYRDVAERIKALKS